MAYTDMPLSDDAAVIRNEIGLVLSWAKYDRSVRDVLRSRLEVLDAESPLE